MDDLVERLARAMCCPNGCRSDAEGIKPGRILPMPCYATGRLDEAQAAIDFLRAEGKLVDSAKVRNEALEEAAKLADGMTITVGGITRQAADGHWIADLIRSKKT